MTDHYHPMIYVACLASYNAGILHGDWIDANEPVEALSEAINTILKSSPAQDAEEWAVHDYDGFGSIELGEYPDLEQVSELAGLLCEHGEPFAAYWSQFCESDGFEQAYRGEWDSRECFAGDIFDELVAPDLQSSIRTYININAFARDLFVCDYTDTSSPRGVYVFSNH